MYLKSYKELIVWQKSIQLVKKTFILTDKLPKSEIYGLVSQMRRAAVSVPSNIAEGYGRRSLKEYAQFYSIAYGSVLELETQIIICKELELLDKQYALETESLLEEVAKMLNSMLGNMKSKLVARS